MELEWILLSKSTNIVEQIRKVQTNLWNPKRLSYLQIDHVEECLYRTKARKYNFECLRDVWSYSKLYD